MPEVNPVRVLIVDDDQAERKRVVSALEAASFQLLVASTHAQAIEHIGSQPPDVIVLRAAPDEAREFVKRLRSNESSRRIPILALGPEREGAALEAGATDELSEPVRDTELLARVRSLAALKFARDELAALESRIEGRVAERTDMLERALRGQGDLLNEAQEARRVWEATFNSIADAIAITDPSGRIILANQAASQMFDLMPSALLAERCRSLIAPGVACPHETDSAEPPVRGYEIMNRARDRLLNVRVSKFENAEGEVAGFVHVIRDVTHERALERQLMQAERMSLAGLMVSAVAHEVATPLSVIANIAEMLLMDAQPDSPAAPELRKIVAQARRVEGMMRGMLNFVRQGPGRFEAVDLAALAKETLDLMEYELKRAGIRPSLIAEPDTPAVWGDRAQLQQVLLNLVANALQAMTGGGRLMIRVAEERASDQDRRAVLLETVDSGPGIPPEAMDRLFTFFYSTRTEEGGTGLGLAISRQIIEGHGGQIWADNAEGGGARFTIRLPAAVARRAAAAKTEAMVRRPDGLPPVGQAPIPGKR